MEQKLGLRKTYLGTVWKNILLIDLQDSLPGRRALDLEEGEVARWSNCPWAVVSKAMNPVGMGFALGKPVGSSLAWMSRNKVRSPSFGLGRAQPWAQDGLDLFQTIEACLSGGSVQIIIKKLSF